MPDKGMPVDLHSVLLSECYKFIRQCKIISIFFRMNPFAFHAILRNNSIELFFDQSYLFFIFSFNLAFVKCRTYIKFTGIGILQYTLPCVICLSMCGYSYDKAANT